MKSNQLINSFNQALKWNALFYSAYKFLTTALTFILFAKLNTQDFSTFANVHSIIFILLLWLDCGFKKSIARFCPEYAQNDTVLRSFTMRIICFKALLLFCAIPLCIFALNYLVIDLDLHQGQHIALLATVMFTFEGLVALLQLLYQANFWSKYFNLVSSIVLAIQMTVSCAFAYYSPSSTHILLAVLYSKIVSGFLIATSSYLLIMRLYTQRTKKTASSKKVNTDLINRSFIHHSAIMWTSNTLKSLTERNVMVPLLTHVLGQSQANIFKVSSDSALFFYRIILKTVGSSDTAILAYARVHNINIEHAFEHLRKKIMILVCSLFTLFLVVLAGKCLSQFDISIIHLFTLITVCYLIEITLSPYERMLEVDQNYCTLFTAYMPYISLLILLFFTNAIHSMGLFITIALIHFVRLISALLVMVFSSKNMQSLHHK